MLINLDQLKSIKKTGFIVIEGVNGSGKTTQLKKMQEYLTSKNKEVVVTREPGGATELGKVLRKILLESGKDPVCDLAELFLFLADRAEHVEKLIKPSLKAGKFVLSDRYYYSTVAFQGYARGLNIEQVKMVNQIAINNTYPDVVFLFDIDPLKGLNRAKSRNDATSGKDGLEEQELAFHIKVREGFLEMAKNSPEPFMVIDADKSIEEIWVDVKAALDNII